MSSEEVKKQLETTSYVVYLGPPTSIFLLPSPDPALELSS
jgi:hypothetical protein